LSRKFHVGHYQSTKTTALCDTQITLHKFSQKPAYNTKEKKLVGDLNMT